MASSPITSWQIDGEKNACLADFLFLGSKITADNDCSLEIGGCFLVGQHIKNRKHHFASEGPYSQRYGFSSSYVWT